MAETIQTPDPKNRSNNALALFLLLILPMPFCLFLYHIIVWSMEQAAVISLTARSFEWAGLIALAFQAVVMPALLGLLWRFTVDERFKPVYAGLTIASLTAFPALILKLIGPNNDQLGGFLQLVICSLGIAGVLFFNRKVEWGKETLPFGLLLAAIGFAPFAIYGAFGSIGDTFLNLLSSMAFGFLASSLMRDTTENIFLDGVGIAAVLALLGSALGYDGSQLILLIVIPSFAWALAALMPSRLATTALISLIAFAGLGLFDPTEFSSVLGDMVGIAMKTAFIAMGIGLFTSVIALILHFAGVSGSRSRTKRQIGWAGAGVMWMVVIALFALFGNPGSYGDRLFVIMKSQADISSIEEIEDRNERLSAAYELLTEHANETQADLRATLDKAHLQYTPYYLQNAMEVRGGLLARLYLQSRDDVDRVIPSPRLRPVPEDSPSLGFESAPEGVQWNIKLIGADKVWSEFNARGNGIVIGQSDTGVDLDHPAIHEQYRGLVSGGDYNWYDPWNHTTIPHDEIGHGTHTTGTILGENGIGVAPDAKWIACVNLDRNLANPALYLDCMQFMLAPFPIGGDPFTEGDPGKAPHVMNNSWGCPVIEGCDADALKQAADNLRYAGIFVVVSTGNDGPACSTVQSPLSLYDSVFSVGAIDPFGNVAPFSSRGPVTADGSNRIKPDIVAPGMDILSATPENTYASFPGTSMAGPHVVGAVALLWSARPELIGDIDATEQLFIETARPVKGVLPSECASGEEQSNVYGYGILDVYEAVKKALEEK